mgnify:CR=1 FL=1
MEPILNLVSPPPSGEEPIPFETLVEAARLALPADMPRDPTKILVAVDLDGTVLLPSGPSPRVREMMAEADRAGLQTVVATVPSRRRLLSFINSATLKGGRSARMAR